MQRSWLLCLSLAACGPSLDPDVAKAAVEASFTTANPAGHTGLELKGKAVWLATTAFDKSCLETKNLAFNDDPGSRAPGMGPRISPTYKAQRYLTAATDVGYCVSLGSDPQLKIEDASWGGDHYRVHVEISMASPSPWFECLTPGQKKREIQVKINDAGQPVVETAIDLGQGACPAPLPGGIERTSTARPTRAPKSAPSPAQLKQLLNDFDDALYEGDLVAALALTTCYNLEEEDDKIGTCSVGEIVSVGPALHGEPRPRDGTPWTEYLLSDVSEIPRPVADRDDATLFHLPFTHKRSGRKRSLSVQWAQNQWTLVGVIGRKSEGLTPIRFASDLVKPDVRDIFERRLAGEEIDDAGNPLNPEPEEP